MEGQEIVILIVVVLLVLYFMNKQNKPAAEGATMLEYSKFPLISAAMKVPQNAATGIKMAATAITEGFIAPNPIGRAFATVIPGERTRVSSQFTHQ